VSPRLQLAVVIVAAFVYALGFHDKGLVMGEEGQILSEAQAILDGKVLYRDLDGYVTPGVWYLTAGVLALAGPSVNATRLVMCGLFALLVGAVFDITRRTASRAWALAALGLMALLKVISFPLGTFVFYTEFSVFFGVAAAWALLVHRQRGGRGLLALAGLAAALSILFKQNVGAYVTLALGAWLLLHHRTRAELLTFAVPGVVVGALTLGLFTAAGALPELLRGLVVVPFSGYYEAARLPYFTVFAPRALTPEESYLYLPLLYWVERFHSPGWGDAWLPLARAVSIAVYATPLGVSAAALVQALRRRRLPPDTQLLLLTALAFFLGSFPRTDFAHLTQSLVGFIPLGLHLAAGARRPRRIAWAAAPLAAATALFCAVLIWNHPYRVRFEHPRARVWLSEPAYNGLTWQLRWIEQTVPRDESLVFIPSGGMYHFLLDRPLLHRYTVLLAPALGHDQGEGFVRTMEELDVRYVVYGIDVQGTPPLESFAPRVHEYIQAHYSPVASRRFRRVETVQILKRNDGA
jgi:hypothetical protein